VPVKGVWIVGVAALLAGCAMSTGILPAGPDTYTISEHYAPIRGGSLGAQQAAMTEANQFCESKGRKFLPENMGVAPGAPIQTNIYGPTNYSVVFQCLLPDDPGFHRPQFEHAPDVVVEQRNRTIP
jgi:hypothetical protein